MILLEPAEHLENVESTLQGASGPHARRHELRGRGQPRDAGRTGRLTYYEAKFLVIPGVHGLALLHAAAAGVRFRLRIKSDSSKFKDDVPLGLKTWGRGRE